MIQMLPCNDLRAIVAEESAGLHSAFARVLDSGRFVLGPEVEAFEQDFADFCGVDFCVGVANGSDGLVLALSALGVQAGDKVATVANAGFYSSAAILSCGAQPLYLDIAPDDYLPSTESIAPILAQRPKAVVATHLYGRMAPVHDWIRSCREHGIALVEDCSQAHGARRDDGRAGSFGDLSVFSFYPTKNLGAFGDGGAIVGSRTDLESQLRQLRQYGWDDKYRVALPGGRNSRLDALQAALLRTRLPLLDQRNHRRRSIAARYQQGIRNPHIHCMPRGGEDDVAHLFAVRSPLRDTLRSHLETMSVQTDVHYPIPDHRQPVMSGVYPEGMLPHTEALAASVLSLPCHPGLTAENVKHVIEACNLFRP